MHTGRPYQNFSPLEEIMRGRLARIQNSGFYLFLFDKSCSIMACVSFARIEA
jgi:hypothetical protein